MARSRRSVSAQDMSATPSIGGSDSWKAPDSPILTPPTNFPGGVAGGGNAIIRTGSSTPNPPGPADAPAQFAGQDGAGSSGVTGNTYTSHSRFQRELLKPVVLNSRVSLSGWTLPGDGEVDITQSTIGGFDSNFRLTAASTGGTIPGPEPESIEIDNYIQELFPRLLERSLVKGSVFQETDIFVDRQLQYYTEIWMEAAAILYVIGSYANFTQGFHRVTDVIFSNCRRRLNRINSQLSRLHAVPIPPFFAQAVARYFRPTIGDPDGPVHHMVPKLLVDGVAMSLDLTNNDRVALYLAEVDTRLDLLYGTFKFLRIQQVMMDHYGYAPMPDLGFVQDRSVVAEFYNTAVVAQNKIADETNEDQIACSPAINAFDSLIYTRLPHDHPISPWMFSLAGPSRFGNRTYTDGSSSTAGLRIYGLFNPINVTNSSAAFDAKSDYSYYYGLSTVQVVQVSLDPLTVPDVDGYELAPYLTFYNARAAFKVFSTTDTPSLSGGSDITPGYITVDVPSRDYFRETLSLLRMIWGLN